MDIHMERKKMKNSKGFTLVEVLIVVAIFSIGAAIAIPNIMDMGRRSAVKSDARQIKDQLAKARIEAIERNRWVTVEYRQANNDYVIFVDSTPPDYIYNNDGTEEVISIVPISSSRYDITQGGGDGIAIGGAGTCIAWDAKGRSYSSGGGLSLGSIYLVGADGSNFEIIISAAGNIRID